MITKKRSWKRWGGAGFLLVGTGFAIAVASGGGPLLSHFAFVSQIFIGIGGSIASCCLTGSIIAIRNCCIKEPDKENLVDIGMDMASDSYDREKPVDTAAIIDILDSNNFSMKRHADECTNLVKKHMKAARDPKKDSSNQKSARDLEKEFFSDPARKKYNYILLLKKYGYKYDQQPTSIIKPAKLNVAYSAPEYLDDSPLATESPCSLSPPAGRGAHASPVDRSDDNSSAQKKGRSFTSTFRTP